MSRPALRTLPLALTLAACSIEVGGRDRTADSSVVLVRLPVERGDSARAPSVGPDARPVGDPSEPVVSMEVPAVPVVPVPPVDSSLEGTAYLRSRRLMVPVEGIAPAELRDTFGEDRGGGSRTHGALDIPAPRGTPVLAADGGRVEKLHESVAGGITLYQFDPSARFVYYYAHLDAYRPGIAEGDVVGKGDVLGYVGETGNAPRGVPHLHFAIGRMDAERRWWRYEPINPLGLLVEPGRASGASARGQISPP